MDRRLSAAARSIGHGLKAATLAVMRFAGRTGNWIGSRVRIGGVDWSKVGDGSSNSIVEAVVGWVSRNFPEAPIVVRRLQGDEWQIEHDHPLARLIERPNEYFSGVLLWMATLVALMIRGNAYWIKVRNGSGNVVALWWVPNNTIEPKWPMDGSEFISHYEYKPQPGVIIRLDPSEVVHFRDGVDPDNMRLGRSRLASVLREIFTDEEAASYTAAILNNLGVPGVVIAPDGDNTLPVDPDDADKVAEKFKEKFGGENRGAALVLTGPTKVTRLSFSPQEMNLRDLRRVPEERVSAVYGVAAIVAGLGAGLDRSTFANFAEARQAAYEECVIPYQRLIGAEIEVQLLPDFEAVADGVDVDFDLSDVRVLADDVDALWKRADLAVRGGWITVASAKKMVGMKPDPGDDVYLRSLTVLTVPTSETPSATAPAPLASVKSAPRLLGTKATTIRPNLALRTRLARVVGEKLKDDLVRYFDGLAKRLLPTVKGTALWDVDGFDWTAEQDAIRAILVRAYGAVGEEVYRILASQTGVDMAFDFTGRGSAKVLDFIGSQVVGIVETTRKELADAVDEARKRGYTVKQLRDGVAAGDFTGDRADETFTGLRDLMQSWADVPGGESRAGLIARTELGYANNLTSNAAYRDSGIVEQVQVFDGDGDEGCAAADGQIWSLDEADANPLEHPNCQRAFAPIFTATEEAA